MLSAPHISFSTLCTCCCSVLLAAMAFLVPQQFGLFLLPTHPPPEAAPMNYPSILCPLQIHQRNLRPALDWVVQHRQQLGVCTAFEFSLHQLAFLQTLQDQGEWQGSARRGGDVVMPCGHVIAEHNDFRRIGSIGPCSVPALLSMGVGGGSKAEGRSSLG